MTKQLIAICVLAVAVCFPAAQGAEVEDGTYTVQFHALLSPSNEVPPRTTDVSGDVVIEFILTRANGDLTSAIVDFHANWRSGQPEEMRAAHIHRGVAGINGPVLINTGLTTQTPSGGGLVFRQTTVTDPAGLLVVEEILANPAGFYFNMHTASAPGGIIRGQLQPDPADTLAKMQAAIQEDLTTKLEEMEARLQANLREIDALVRLVGRLPPTRVTK